MAPTKGIGPSCIRETGGGTPRVRRGQGRRGPVMVGPMVRAEGIEPPYSGLRGRPIAALVMRASMVGRHRLGMKYRYGWNNAVRPSRRPLRGLLRMTIFLNAI